MSLLQPSNHLQQILEFTVQDRSGDGRPQDDTPPAHTSLSSSRFLPPFDASFPPYTSAAILKRDRPPFAYAPSSAPKQVRSAAQADDTC